MKRNFKAVFVFFLNQGSGMAGLLKMDETSSREDSLIEKLDSSSIFKTLSFEYSMYMRTGCSTYNVWKCSRSIQIFFSLCVHPFKYVGFVILSI